MVSCLVPPPQLDPALFPEQPEAWSSCAGSQPHYRGYPCALWMLFHAATLLTLPIRERLDGVPPRHRLGTSESLSSVSAFVTNFFSCEECRHHFAAMSAGQSEDRVRNPGDAALWLWEAHNAVNRRLASTASADPAHPKRLFPDVRACPYCYTPVHPGGKGRPTWNNTGFAAGQGLVGGAQTLGSNVAFVWNRTAVLLFLCRFYHIHGANHTHPRDILRAAWPDQFPGSTQLRLQYRGAHGDIGFNEYDITVCVLSYAMCVLCIAVVTYWLVVKRRRRFRRFLYAVPLALP